ncbi:MAG TPA: PAS domain-containing protein [Deltaproteobacteria bacterium]|nr:PAS domain-containing protein [Deltaproteobacteria bacterium]
MARKTSTDAGLIIESIADGLFTVDENWRITSFNRAAEEITGIPREEALGRMCKDVLHASCCETNCPMREAIQAGSRVVSRIVSIVDSSGAVRSISISASGLKDSQGRPSGGVETFRDIGSIEAVRNEVMEGYSCQDILSVNHRMREIFAILPAVADSASTVLLEGETGTGKELFARAIHNLSPRRAQPFIALNCGALPDTLLESELFGYKAGAFTDAKRDKPGRFELAQGGTIFLDEIGDISAALQVRLLRVIQEKTYEPLGGVRSKKTDARIITATNRDLETMVQQGRFRKDLYYRLNVIKIRIPPLRERKEDLPILVDHFIARFNAEQGKNLTGMSESALQYLLRHDFPGNIRELENIIERAFILCRSGTITRQHLPRFTPEEDLDQEKNYDTLKTMEASFLMRMLKKNDWNRKKTAEELGIHKSTLFRKIRSLGIDVPRPSKNPPEHD